jgi:hypothetical protein
MHTEHIYEDKIECNQCHLEIQHKIVKDIETIADCGSCHTDYHKAQKILYIGEGGKGLDHPMPNIMLEKGLSCKGCHIFHEEHGGAVITSDTLVSDAKACESCHGKGFARILEGWEESTAKKLSQIKSIYGQVKQVITRTKHEKKTDAEALLEEADFNIEIVEQGKSVHNVTFSQELLMASYNKMIESLRVVESGYKPQAFQIVSSEIPTLCANCHQGIEEINKEIFGLSFPHKKHLIEQKIDCSTCHSNVRTHGEFIATKQSCATCHHKDTKIDCAHCHTLQNTYYQGGEMNGQEIPKDIMAEADVECIDCHLREDDKIVRSNKGKCIDCHEEDYAEMHTEWQATVKELISSITDSIREKRNLRLAPQERDILRGIEKELQTIKLDGSIGIHNYLFIEEILTDLKNKLGSLDNFD